MDIRKNSQDVPDKLVILQIAILWSSKTQILSVFDRYHMPKLIRSAKFTDFISNYGITLSLNHATACIFGKEISSTFRCYVV